MPDWSYRTLLRPVMLGMGAERARRLALLNLRLLSRLPVGLAAIDFLGHMRADPRLARTVGGIPLDGPVALGSMIDPEGRAVEAWGRFGGGLVTVGPVVVGPTVVELPREHETDDGVPAGWTVDLAARRIRAETLQVAPLARVEKNLGRRDDTRVCVRIGETETSAIARVVAGLGPRASFFVIPGGDARETAARVRAALGTCPVLVSLTEGTTDPRARALAAREAGAAGVWVESDDARASIALVRMLRESLSEPFVIACGGVTQPDDVRAILEAGGDLAIIDAGLVISGPGLVKRCNEALLSALPATRLEPLTLVAARRSWFWALLLGVAMFGGGLMALIIASTRVVLPYDEALCGMTRGQLASLNPRLLPFMAHDRVSLAGTMLSIGIFYAALGWFGVRSGRHWAQVTVIVSTTVGFFTFFLFLGFGYFDPFHAFVTAILTQFALLCTVLPPSLPQPPRVAEWFESAAWKRGQWGQLLFITIGIALAGAGLIIAFIGCTQVFVATDVAFLRSTAAQWAISSERILPLVAHDRASLGGMLIANGVAIWLTAQWGMRVGERWIWWMLAVGGNIAFLCALAVHAIVGYGSPLHLAPALLGWVTWNVALGLSRGWLFIESERVPVIA